MASMKVTIVSGFFNPLHGGHLDMIEAAALMGDKLIVVVNNDVQQIIKKGKVILNEQNRARLLGALRVVDEVVIAVDEDPTVVRTLQMIALQHPDDDLIFANGFVYAATSNPQREIQIFKFDYIQNDLNPVASIDLPSQAVAVDFKDNKIVFAAGNKLYIYEQD